MRDGEELYVRVIGRGAPVVLLPGLGMSSSHWLPFVLPYAGRFRFFLPEQRGSGRSAHLRVAKADVFQGHADDVHDVLAYFRLDSFLLGGISLGCTTALHVLRDYGFAHVRAYLHMEQSPCVGNREGWQYGLFGAQQDARFVQLRRALALLELHPQAKSMLDLAGAARVEAADVFSGLLAAMSGDETQAPRLRAIMRSPFARFLPLSQFEDVRAYLRSYLAGGHDYRPALRGCATPITLMYGKRSALYPPAGQLAIAELAKDVTVVPFEHSGHVPLIDQPFTFFRALGRWLHS
jgi:non-heme chloroperoxidase